MPRPLPEKIVKAWTDAGAEVGWLRINEFRTCEWSNKLQPGSLLMFQFGKWEEGLIARLPGLRRLSHSA